MNNIKRWYKLFLIYIWWNFIIKKDEFHPSLNNLDRDNIDIIYNQRGIAHLLDEGLKISMLPKSMVRKFKIN